MVLLLKKNEKSKTQNLTKEKRKILNFCVSTLADFI